MILLALVGEAADAQRYSWPCRTSAISPLEAVEIAAVGVVGANSVAASSPGRGPRMSEQCTWSEVTVALDSVIEGDIPAPGEVTVVFLEPQGIGSGPGPYSMPFGKRALLLLSRAPGEEGRFELQQYSQGAPPPLLLASKPPGAAVDGAADDRLAAELLAACGSGDDEVAFPAAFVLGGLAAWGNSVVAQQGVLALLREGRAGIITSVCQPFSGVPGPDEDMRERLHAMRDAGDPAVVAAVYASLLRLGEVDILDEAMTWAKACPEGSAEAETVYSALGSPRLVEGPAAALPLARWAVASGSPAAQVRVARSLRKIATEEITDALAVLLDAEDREAQYHAIMGMYHAVGAWRDAALRHLGPVTTLFDADPDRYVTAWRTWYGQGRRHAPVTDQYGDPIESHDP